MKVYYDNVPANRQVQMLDEVGILLNLQQDTVTNFARHVALNSRNLTHVEKRFSFSSIYRRKED